MQSHVRLTGVRIPFKGVRFSCLYGRNAIPALVLAVVAVVLPTSLAFGSGLNCQDPVCDEGGTVGIDPKINCVTKAVTGHSCIEPVEVGVPSLLRVAVRCYDSAGSQEARYMDRAGFTVGQVLDFTALVSNTGFDAPCTNFIASAHWISGATQAQAQCSSGVVPDCITPGAADLQELADGVRLYSGILPAANPNLPNFPERSCFTGTDFKRVEIRNKSVVHAYQGVVAGRYVCAAGDDPNDLSACDGSSPGTRPPKGRYGKIDGFNIGTNSFAGIDVNPGVGFDFCCDHEVDSELPIGSCESGGDPTGLCSPADLQCASAAVFSICVDGQAACAADPSLFTPLSRVVWLGPVLDMNPGNHPTTNPAQYSTACLRFDFYTTLAADSDNETDTHEFGPPDAQAPVADYCSATGNQVDEDFDGVYDVCDPLLFSRGVPDVGHRITLRNTLRNQQFYSATFAAGNEVRVAGIVSPEVSVAGNELVATVPSTGVQQGGLPLAVDWRPTAGAAWQPAPQGFAPEFYAYATNGLDDQALFFDPVKEREGDGSPSPTKTRVNLNCDPADTLAQVKPPQALDPRPVEAPPGSGVQGDGDVFFVSDVVTTTNTVEYRLFGIDVRNNRLLTPTGVQLAGSGRALDVESDLDGVSRAYVGRALGLFNGAISVVNVDPDSPELWTVNDGSMVPGVPYAIRVKAAGSTVKAYVTSVECSPGGGLQATCGEGGGELGPQGGFGGGEEMMGPICIECGGGGGTPWRRLVLSTYDVTDPENIVRECSRVLSEITTIPDSCISATTFPNMGMAFNLAKTKLFVANPDEDSVEVLDLATDTLDDPILIGDAMVVDEPVDVVVVRTADPGGEEMAYVANRQSRTISRFRVAAPTTVLSKIEIDPDNIFPLRKPVAVAVRSDGKRLFTADSTGQTVSVIDIVPFSPSENDRVGEIVTGGDSRRLVVLRLP